MGKAPETRAAFDELAALLGQVGDRYLTEERGMGAEIEVLEGYRYVTHLLSGALELHLESDPERPRFTRIVHPGRKFLGDNPDAVYFWTRIRGDRTYRITGVRDREVYVSFTIHGRDPAGGSNEPVLADINDRQLDIGPDGSYEIVLSPEKQPGNWVQLHPDAVSVITRHYFLEEGSAAADPDLAVTLHIESLDEPGPPPPLDDATLAERLRRVTSLVRANTVERPLPRDTPDVPFVSRVPNQLPAPASFRASGMPVWGAVDIAYCSGSFQLRPDEALVMEGTIPECAFANVMLWNRHLQTYDYLHRPTWLNKRQMHLDGDGRYRIVVAPEDPGVPDWLDTAGHLEGTIFWRFLLPETDPDTPACTVMPVAEVRATAR